MSEVQRSSTPAGPIRLPHSQPHTTSPQPTLPSQLLLQLFIRFRWNPFRFEWKWHAKGPQEALYRVASLTTPSSLRTLAVDHSQVWSIRGPFTRYVPLHVLLSRPQVPRSAIWRTVICVADPGCLLVTTGRYCLKREVQSIHPSCPPLWCPPASQLAGCARGVSGGVRTRFGVLNEEVL